MMNPYEIESTDPESGAIRVIIDTPAGSRNKYKFDQATGLFTISRVLPLGMAFPHDFGSIPSTQAEDGDPLDSLVLGTAPTFPGCLVSVRLLGVIRATQVEGRRRIRNDRLIATATTPVNHPHATALRDLESAQIEAIEQFFISYNRAHGREFRVSGRGGPRDALRLVKQAQDKFAREAKVA